MKKDRKKWIVVIFVLFILIGVGSYGLISYSKKGTTSNQITTGSITMKYTEESNALVLSNAVPLTDEEGKREKEQVFDFTVSIDVTGDFSVAYEVVAEKEVDFTSEDENIKPLEDQYIKLYLERSNDGKNYEEVMAPTIYTPITETTSFGAPAGSMILETGVVTETTKYYYRLRMWVDGSYERENESRTYAVKVNVYGTTEKNTLDEKGPVCRLEPNGELNVGKETEVKLICTDATTGLVEKRLTIEDFINSNEEVGTITSISDPVKTANGYEYTLMIQGNKVGTTIISLKEGVLEDSLGNQNGLISKELEVIDPTTVNSYTVTYDYASNGGSSSSKTTDIVNYQAEIDLKPTAEKAGYTFVGWNTNQDAHEGLKSLTMKDQDVTLYAIYRKEVEATFYYYDGTSQANSKATCSLYNLEESCNYTVPEVVTSSVGPNESTYRGVSTNPSSEEITTTVNSLTTSYYAVYQGRWTITYKVGANVKENGIGSTDNGSSCDMVVTSDGESYTGSSCTIQTLPTITNIEGYDNENDISVWSTEIGATEGSEPGSSYTLTGNITLYANGVDKTRPTVELVYTSGELEKLADWSQKKEVKIIIKDSGSGLSVEKDGTKTTIWYGWSTSKTSAPENWIEREFNHEEGAKEIRFSAYGSNLNGTYYLWWANPIIYDVAGNPVILDYNDGAYGIFADTVFKFDNTAPTVTFSLEEDSNANATDQSTRYTKTKSVAVALSDEYSGVVDNKIIQYTWCKADDSTCTGWTDVSPSSTTTDSDGKKIVTYTINQGSLTGEYYLSVNHTTVGDMATNKLSEDKRTVGEFYFDNTAPTCSDWSGESTTWTSQNRTITATCSDSQSGCVNSTVSQTYNTTTKVGKFSQDMTDKAGNSKKCTGGALNVYVEKESSLTAPTIAGSYTSPDTAYYNGVVIYVRSAGNAANYSGVAKYQYYDSTSSTSLTGGSWKDLTYVATGWGDFDYIFDPVYYATMSWSDGDSQNRWDTNKIPASARVPSELFYHFVEYTKDSIGVVQEFRRGNEEFDLATYMKYDDLKAAFGTDHTQYINHYIEHGRAEGRVAKPAGEAPWIRSGQYFPDNTNRYIFFRAITNVGNASPQSNSQSRKWV